MDTSDRRSGTGRYRELYVRFTDGTARVVDTDENTPEGRRRQQKIAFRYCNRWDVESVQGRPTDRLAQTGSKGRAR